MSDVYQWFQKLAAMENPLASTEYIQLTSNSPDLAKQLATLLSFSQTPSKTLLETIFQPLTTLDQPETRIGRIIDNKYKIIELIGQGGMSDVYKAKRVDGLIEHTVAVKYFSLADSFNTALEMIKKEAQVLAQLDHHFIASFIDIGHDNHHEPNIMMEYIQGHTLFAFLKTNPHPNALSQVYSTLNEAKNYAEQQGIIHGDISLNNVLVDENGNANIVDFDLARYQIKKQC
ncbi:protein kinase domain-containing protein [Paraglaciecola aestuariivivens]